VGRCGGRFGDLAAARTAAEARRCDAASWRTVQRLLSAAACRETCRSGGGAVNASPLTEPALTSLKTGRTYHRIVEPEAMRAIDRALSGI